MTRFRPLALALVAIPLATPAFAQSNASPWQDVEINPYVGAFIFDDSELEKQGLEANVGVILGGRVGVTRGDDWLFEGSYGYASVTIEPSEFVSLPDPDFERDLAVHLLHATASYLIGTDVAPTQLVLSAGLGAMWADPEEGDADGDFIVTLGAGFTHPINEWISFKGDVKDHIAFCSAPERAGEFSTCLESEALNHFEVSGGLQFYVF